MEFLPVAEGFLKRFVCCPMGTFGRLTIGGWSGYTVERPWLDNQPRVSCIPQGCYRLRQRPSGVVTRSTGGQYTHGWEVCDVPGRTYILVHPANTIDDVEGCIGPGSDLGVVAGKWAVLNSRQAFDALMTQLSARTDWTIEITG